MIIAVYKKNVYENMLADDHFVVRKLTECNIVKIVPCFWSSNQQLLV